MKSDSITFGQYGKSFQEKIVQALLTDPQWAEQLMEVIDVSYFDLKYLVFLADRYFSYARKYKIFPSLQMLITIIRDDLKQGNDILLRDQIIDYLQRMRMNPDLGDLPGVKAKTLDFCRKQALQIALETAVEHMASEKYEQIVDVVKKAVMVGTTSSVGHEFFEDYDARFTRLARNCVPTGIKELDKKEILNGGLARGTLGCVIGATGTGKCVFQKTKIRIRYKQVKIAGKFCDPWDMITTSQGDVYAKNIKEIVKTKQVEKFIEIGDFFNRLGYSSECEPTEKDGDSCFNLKKFNINVESDAGYYQIEAIRWTKPEPMTEFSHHYNDDEVVEGTIPTLCCSPEHLVMTVDGWTKAGDLVANDLIMTSAGIRKIGFNQASSETERLCDLQVADVHRYYTNGVLSHNSHWLTFLGANALKAGLNVLHYTFELSEEAIGVRYDSTLCDINSNQVIDRKDEVRKRYSEMKGLGRLFIKEYPTNTASIYTLRSHVERLQVTKGFIPDIICIDYADIMRSSRQFDSLRHELKLVYEELRGWASESHVAIWTASQSNKEGANSDIVDLSNMSEAYGKAMVADVIVSISRKPQEKASGFARLFMAKNREGLDGLLWSMQIDTSTSTFTIVGDEFSPSEAKSSDEQDIKAKIRERWDEVKRDKMLKLKEKTKKENLAPEPSENKDQEDANSPDKD